MSVQITQKPIYFKNLDALRFLAAFMVVFAHAIEGYWDWYPKDKPAMFLKNNLGEMSFWGETWDKVIQNGSFGVDIFFLISGFLITYLLISEKTKTGRINYPKFFVRRALRIWPLYICVLLVSPYLVYKLKYEPPDYWPNILFYSNYHSIHLSEIGKDAWQFPFAHLWSICVEEHFYLFWPLFVWLIPLKRLPSIMIALIVVSIGSRLYYFQFSPSTNLQTYLNTICRMDILIIGALYAWYYHKFGFKPKISRWLRTVLYLVLITYFFTFNIHSSSNLMAVIFAKIVPSLIAGMGMVYFIFNTKENVKIPGMKIWTYLGKISFGIYLISNLLIPFIIKKMLLKWQYHDLFLYFALTAFLTIGLASLMYYILEKPILKLKKRFEIVNTARSNE